MPSNRFWIHIEKFWWIVNENTNWNGCVNQILVTKLFFWWHYIQHVPLFVWKFSWKFYFLASWTKYINWTMWKQNVKIWVSISQCDGVIPNPSWQTKYAKKYGFQMDTLFTSSRFGKTNGFTNINIVCFTCVFSIWIWIQYVKCIAFVHSRA